MDFESPDVEKDFPGLFASESIKKCNDSDFSDENHDKSYKKELISGKKKDKKDSKKDRGYAALEGESSADENTDSKSPSKSKKSKSFKFPTKKSEKREKSREKDAKEKEPDKEKKKDKEKKDKDKIKLKDKKKSRHAEELSDGNGEYPVFGVDLDLSVERSGCLDGVAIPLVVRNCIDCIHNSGLTLDGLYKTVGVKSKVLAMRRAYNLRETVALKDHDVFVSTCLLKTFLRELPEPLLTRDLLTRFEEAGAIMEVDAREVELQNLIQQLPYHNRVLLSWLIVHFDTVTLHEKQNKLNAQSIAMTFSPVLQMSHRLLTAFLCHCKALFPDTVIEPYVPPLCAGSPLPEKSEEIVNELRKQESLLNQIHKEMSQGYVSKKREEQLWEVQRIVTQLKRTLRILQKSQETNTARSLEEDQGTYEENTVPEEPKKAQSQDTKEEVPKVADESKEGSPVMTEPRKTHEVDGRVSQTQQESNKESQSSDVKPVQPKPSCLTHFSIRPGSMLTVTEGMKNAENLELVSLQFEHEHLSKLHAALESRLESERKLIEKLQMEIKNLKNDRDSPFGEPDAGAEDKMVQLIEENNSLKQKKDVLVWKIYEERLACLNLKININLLEEKWNVKTSSQVQS